MTQWGHRWPCVARSAFTRVVAHSVRPQRFVMIGCTRQKILTLSTPTADTLVTILRAGSRLELHKTVRATCELNKGATHLNRTPNVTKATHGWTHCGAGCQRAHPEAAAEARDDAPRPARAPARAARQTRAAASETPTTRRTWNRSRKSWPGRT